MNSLSLRAETLRRADHRGLQRLVADRQQGYDEGAGADGKDAPGGGGMVGVVALYGS